MSPGKSRQRAGNTKAAGLAAARHFLEGVSPLRLDSKVQKEKLKNQT